MRVLSETAALLESLDGVWDEDTVDELGHALQSAAAAIADGADDELVLAATLHDLAHSPLLAGPGARNHDRVAYEWLAPRFGERVGWLAGSHVAAKRYLAATQPGYAEALSPTSVVSLRHQGGAHVDTDLAAHPWWPDALRLRHYDDAAKDPHARGTSIADVLEVAQRVSGKDTAP